MLLQLITTQNTTLQALALPRTKQYYYPFKHSKNMQRSNNQQVSKAQQVQAAPQQMAPGNPQASLMNPSNLGGPSSNPVTNQILEANNVSSLSFMDEMNAAEFELSTRFNYSQAIVWQIKYILSSYLTKKTLATASSDLQYLSERFGTDFDKYLLKELIEQIDLKDPNKGSKDKNEPIKSQLLVQELNRIASKPDFLKCFEDNEHGIFGWSKYADFLNELTKRLKLSSKLQLNIALALAESCVESAKPECFTLLKQKIVDYMLANKSEPLEEYAVHRLVYMFAVYPEFQDLCSFSAHPPQFKEAKQEICSIYFEQNSSKPNQSVAMRIAMNGCDLLSQNPSPDDPSNSLIRVGSDFEHLMQASKIMQPWEVLLDLGHYSSFDYQVLNMALQDFKDINERTMANTILQLALNHTGKDDYNSRLALNSFKSNKTGEAQLLKKEPGDKTTIMQWHADANHFARAFRENFSSLNWSRVFESFAELDSEIYPDFKMDQKAYMTLLQIFNKSKPQNLQVSTGLLLDKQWASPALQFQMIKHAIGCFISNEDKTFNLQKSARKIASLGDITLITEVNQQFIDVWSQPEIIEILVKLSETNQYVDIRKFFEEPLSKIPEYLILTISKCEFSKGNILIDELMSILMPIFLVNQANSVPVLKKLWDFNQSLMIRGICESCRHEQRIMNLSRVLDITQDIKDSLIKIVYCQDYDFAVNLGILAGKREFLHYDVWLKERIKKVGTPFVKAFIAYINEQIIVPCREYMIKNGFANPQRQLTQEEQEQLDQAREQILERSHLSKERLCMTMEHLENPANFQALVNMNTNAEERTPEQIAVAGIMVKVSMECQVQIKDLVAQYAILFPKQVSPTQSTEEIDKAANEYFQHIFAAEPHQVDERIQELIVTLQNFQKSQVVKEQEIYACVLHGLFDEYRFLHKYPQPYLQKIAKLFGAIIKNNLLNPVLQGIALKFVIEAFRRDGKRLMFGIIVVKEFFDCLPDFPRQFQEIYANRDKIREKDPALYQQLEDLYKQHMQNDTESTDGRSRMGMHVEEAPQGAYRSHAISDGGDQAFSDGTDMFDFTKSESEFDQKNLFQPQGSDKEEHKKDSKEEKASKQDHQALQKPKMPVVNQSKRKISPNVRNNNNNLNILDVNAESAQGRAENLKAPNPNSQGIRADSAEVSSNPMAGTLNVASRAFTRTDGPGSSNATSKEPKNPQRASNNKNANMVQFQQQQQNSNQGNMSSGKQVVGVQQPPSLQPLNKQAKSFRPSDNLFQTPVVPMITPQHVAWQKTIDQRIEDAKLNKQQRLRFEDLIEDSTLAQPSQEAIDSIKLKCNNTGKNNFKQKLEELKDLVTVRQPGSKNKNSEEATEEQRQEATINLNWFINYILTKRISGQNQTLHHIYIELIRQLGQKDSVSKTIQFAYQIFCRCMLIDEEEFNKVSNKVSGTVQQSSAIKQYLVTLGTFLGSLTLAKNRPIHSKELDLKQLLLQGYQHESRRSIIAFVCRIMKEANKSLIFNKVSNPWVCGILQVLREMYADPTVINHQDDIKMEIESLFKALQVSNLNEIPVLQYGTLHAYAGIGSFNSVTQEIELSYMHQKSHLIPTRQRSSKARSSGPSGLGGDLNYNIDAQIASMGGNDADLESDNFNTIQFIFDNVLISDEKRNYLKSKFVITDPQITELMAKAVDQSIIEILKPVVDRSVTIALITTKELVLKDFAFDGDCKRIIEASEQIVQNLAGSLALVTCREPLRIQLNNFLHKALKLACYSAGSTTGLTKSQPFEGMTQKDEENMQKQDSALNYYIQDCEEQLQEIAQEASKENLELGCKIIKKAVIKQAMVWVKQDPVIIEALEKRRKSKEAGEQFFVDKEIAASIAELPAQLQPNKGGLTQDQYKVYSDFAKLNSKTKLDQPSLGAFPQVNPGEMQFMNSLDSNQNQAHQEPAIYDFTLDSILGRIEKKNELDSVSRSLMTMKLAEMCKSGQSRALEDQKNKLWNFCENKFNIICTTYDNESSISEVMSMVQVLCLIVNKLKTEKFQQRLLAEVFFKMEEMYYFNVDLHMILIKERIFPLAEWDEETARFIKNLPGSLQEKAFTFLAEIISRSVLKNRSMNLKQIPQIMSLIETSNNSIITPTLKQLRGLQATSQEDILRKLYIKWVELSSTDFASPEKEKETIDQYFEELIQLGLEKDQNFLFTFCNVMVKESIDLSLCSSNGQRRLNNNTLDYRFIDSLTMLFFVLLQNFEKLNKLQFMSKIFEFIKQKLHTDHNSKQDQFNQKPYYRLLMNILRAVTNENMLNQKIQKQILFEMSDLLKELSPNVYPAFAFAWLELISHKLFMPYFIKSEQGTNQGETSSTISQTQLQKNEKIKELLCECFTFIKLNLVTGQKASQAMRSFYTATMNIVLVILKDYPQFLCDYHFNFVNSLPETAIQLKNMILAAFPKSIQPPNPFSQDLKVDTMNDVSHPRILSNYESYLSVFNLKDDLKSYFDTRDPELIKQICMNMMMCNQRLKQNDKGIPSSSVINAVVLFIAQKACNERKSGTVEGQQREKENIELFKEITVQLNEETRLSFLNSIVNELRYPNSHTFFFCLILLRLFVESKPNIQEQISTILFERLQALRPYPWGLMINFRELIQNTKYGFMKSPFIAEHQDAIKNLFQNKDRLRPFFQFIQQQRTAAMPQVPQGFTTQIPMQYQAQQQSQFVNHQMQQQIDLQNMRHAQQVQQMQSRGGRGMQSDLGGHF